MNSATKLRIFQLECLLFQVVSASVLKRAGRKFRDGLTVLGVRACQVNYAWCKCIRV